MNPDISMTGTTRYRHVIWDWNGTLFDDAWLCLDVMNTMLRMRGMPEMSMSRYREIFDFPVIDYYRRIGFDFGRESFEVLGTEFIDAYETRRLECGLRPETESLVKELHRRGVTQAVLSAYRQATLEELTAHFGIRDYFEDVIGHDDHYAAGKIPQGRRYVETLTIPREQIVMIGDTVHDAEVAAAMGVGCILIPGGNQAPEKLRSAGVRYVESPAGLADLLLQEGA